MIDSKVKTLINTLVLVGFSEVERKQDDKESYYTGLFIEMKHDQFEHIAMSFTQAYCSFTGSKISPFHFLYADIKKEDALDKMTTKIINNLGDK